MRRKRTQIALCSAILGLLACAPAGYATPAAGGRLFAAVSRTGHVSLRNRAGAVVRKVRAGSYVVVVHDRSKRQNFHLVGSASNMIDKKTGIRFVGTARWTLSFQPGVYNYHSDRSPTMHSVLRVG